MFEKRNETLLNKEFTTRRMRQAEQERLAQQLSPQRNGISFNINVHKAIWAVATLITIALLIVTGEVHAEERVMERTNGVDRSPAMEAFAEGFNAMNDGDYAGAIVHFDDCINRKPDYASAYAFRGAAYYLLEDYQPALDDFDIAVSLSPDYASAYNWRAKTYLATGEHEQALVDSRMAITIDPSYVEAYQTLTMTYFSQRQYLNATATLLQYLSHAKGNA